MLYERYEKKTETKHCHVKWAHFRLCKLSKCIKNGKTSKIYCEKENNTQEHTPCIWETEWSKSVFLIGDTFLVFFSFDIFDDE